MSHLAIALLGGFHAELDGRPLTAFGTNKVRALLAYLALESGTPLRRETLASLLWPEDSEHAARNSLRQALFQLHRLIGHEPETEPHLLITAAHVQMNPAGDCRIDVAEFNSSLSACLAHHPGGMGLCGNCLETLQRGIQLYQGDLLAGLTLPRCAQFTDWQVISQEHYHRQALTILSLLANCYEANREYEQLIACTQREIELEPWRETAYRRQMWALAMTGQREQALFQYKTLHETLLREMGILPTGEITLLYQQIRNGDLPGVEARQAELLCPLESGHHALTAKTVPFAGRKAELAQLAGFLAESLSGGGRVAFVSGEAGSGKTALLNEFACRAMFSHRDLLLAGGACSAYSGLGDPYQPIREVLESLAGISGAPAGSRALGSEELARRLALARPAFLRALLDESPGLSAVLFPLQDLLRHAREITGLDAALLARLEAITSLPVSGLAPTGRDACDTGTAQAPVFMQITRLLHTISCNYPIMILLDDLQWIDPFSASLLFYLGRHLADGRILILGAYRPEDLVLSPGPQRHPLAALLHEFQRSFGEIHVDLSRANGRAFVDACLDCQPNHFSEEFREMLYRQTGGNALFVVDLLLAMQGRGDVIQDNTGHWVQGARIDWTPLPARAEAVIEEQLGRLDDDCINLLKAASLLGGEFTAGVLAQAVGTSEERIRPRLASLLSKQTLLTTSCCPGGDGRDSPLHYQFHSLLLQEYLTQSQHAVEQKRVPKQARRPWKRRG